MGSSSPPTPRLLCNISDSSAAKNNMKRQIVWGKGKWICYVYATTRKQNATITVELKFPSFFSVSFIETRVLKLTIIMKIEMYLYYLTRRRRMPISGLIEKRVIFSHAYRGSSRSLHGVTTYVKPPGFKQLNWRIRENLSQSINKLSLLVSEDAMIVPATYIYSVLTFAQNSLDMSPWSKHHYFRFYKLDVAKVINRLILPCTPLTTVSCKFSGILFQSRSSF